MNKIPVEELKPGMMFDKPVYIDRDNMLVGANIPLEEGHIKKLMTWGVTSVESMGQLINQSQTSDPPTSIHAESERKIFSEYQELLKKRKRLMEVHKKAELAVESIYNTIRQNSQFDISQLDLAAIDIINILKENSNIFLFLYGLDEGKDYLVTHSVHVTFYSIIIGLALKYDMNKLKDLALGTLMIDAGMIKMPAYITHKQSNLTEQEFKQIKTHPLHGYKVIKDLADVKEKIAIVSLQHHEQFDGMGYPRSLRGEDIDEFARIAAIADSYEAQISNKSYKKKVDFYHAMRNLLSSGVNKFDPVILRVFLSRMSVYPIGSIVKLNNESSGIVIGSIPEKPLRPIIKLVFDEKGIRILETKIVNLLQDSSLYITKALNEEDAGISIFEVL